MNNLAAAVESLRDRLEYDREGINHCNVKVSCKDLETILAELGRGAGEPVAEVVKPPNGFGVTFMDGFENLPGGTKLYTRPPVAGLAELTDVKLVELYSELRHTSKEFCGLPHPMENWAEAHDAAIAKAARQFLGKVDG